MKITNYFNDELDDDFKKHKPKKIKSLKNEEINKNKLNTKLRDNKIKREHKVKTLRIDEDE